MRCIALFCTSSRIEAKPGSAQRTWPIAILLLALFSAGRLCLAQVFEPHTNRFGMDIRDFDLDKPDPRLCYEACTREKGCRAFTYLRPHGWAGAGDKGHCWLKSGVPPAKSDNCCISGVLRSESRGGPVSAGVLSVSSVIPPNGPATGGIRVTIRGSGFSGATRVTFGGNPAENFKVISDREVNALLPPLPNPAAISANGYHVDAAVCTPAGCSPQYMPGNFTYHKSGSKGAVAPRVSSVIPPNGSAAGGIRITIRGSGFSGATRVTFGGNPAENFKAISDTEVSAVLPPFPNPAVISASGYQVDAAVCTPAGCSPQYAPGNFTYYKSAR